MLQKFNVSVSKEEADKVDTLRYSFQKLSHQAVRKVVIKWARVTC